MVAYQTSREVSWKGEIDNLCGRTFEEDFGLENPDWSQNSSMKHLGLNVMPSPETPTILAQGLHKIISQQRFDKTKFALTLLTEDDDKWEVPKYIRDGLLWLEREMTDRHNKEASL